MEVTTHEQEKTAQSFLPEDFAKDQDISAKIEEIIGFIDADGVSNVPVKIYKYDNSQWEQIGYTSAESVPTTHDVGLEHGAGKFKFLFSWKSPRHTRGRVNYPVTFVLGENYNVLRAQNQFKKNANQQTITAALPYQAPAAAPTGGDQFLHALIAQMQMQIQKSHELTLELIKSRNNDGGGDLQKWYLGEISQRSTTFLENQSSAFNKGLELARDAQVKEEKENSTLEIIKVIADAAPDILSKFTSKERVVKKIHSYPGAKEVLSNPAKVREVFDGVSNIVGMEKAAKIADKANIRIPEINNEIKLKVV